jgi:hypothetical protein
MFPPVFQWLKASADVKNIVGTNPPRIYRHGAAPQTADGKPMALPYVTWFVVTDQPANNLSDPVPVDRFGIQVDCWHQTDTGIELLAEAVRDALELHGVCTGLIANLREPETRLFRIGLTFDIWHGRPLAAASSL